MSLGRQRHWRHVVAIGLLAGCAEKTSAPGPLSEYPFAMVTPECGPADGPSLSFYFTATAWNTLDFAPAAPFTRVAIWDDPAVLVGRTTTWYGEGLTGSAQRCSSASDCVGVNAARVTLGRFAADSSLDVTVDLHFTNGIRVEGSAKAAWRPRRYLCG